MKQPKGLKLKLDGGSRANILQFKCNQEEKNYFQKALEKLNSISILQFSLSDFLRMGVIDLSERINNEIIKIELDIPERKIIFDLAKTKR